MCVPFDRSGPFTVDGWTSGGTEDVDLILQQDFFQRYKTDTVIKASIGSLKMTNAYKLHYSINSWHIVLLDPNWTYLKAINNIESDSREKIPSTSAPQEVIWWLIRTVWQPADVSTTDPLHISRSTFEPKYTGCKLFLDIPESIRQKYGPVSWVLNSEEIMFGHPSIWVRKIISESFA